MYELRTAVLENEKMFQQMNDNLQRSARGLTPMGVPEDLMLAMYCECADPACEERIRIELQKYRELIVDYAQYAHGQLFLVKPDHIFPRFEQVFKKFRNYWILKKTMEPK